MRQRCIAVVRTFLLDGIPSWLRQGTALVIVWLAFMTAITLWTPWNDLDHRYLEHLEASQDLSLYPSMQLVDVRIDDSGTPAAIGRSRCMIAGFVDGLVDRKQRPAALVLDFAFHPAPPTPPCQAGDAARSRSLSAAITKVEQSGTSVYTTVGDLPLSDTGTITGTPAPLDSAVASAIPSGHIGHTQMRFPGRPMCQRCYQPAGFRGGEEWSTARDIWSIPDLVTIPDIAQSSVSLCNTSPEMVFVGDRK